MYVATMDRQKGHGNERDTNVIILKSQNNVNNLKSKKIIKGKTNVWGKGTVLIN